MVDIHAVGGGVDADADSDVDTGSQCRQRGFYRFEPVDPTDPPTRIQYFLPGAVGNRVFTRFAGDRLIPPSS